MLRSASATDRRQWLKELAADNAICWRIASLRPSLDGLTRLETRHQSIYFQDGVCVRAASRNGDTSVPCRMMGMRLVGWITDDDRLLSEHVPGARALLWRGGNDDMTVCLTARGHRFEQVLPLSELTELTLRVQYRPAEMTAH
jgi:hypothetical protein